MKLPACHHNTTELTSNVVIVTEPPCCRSIRVDPLIGYGPDRPLRPPTDNNQDHHLCSPLSKRCSFHRSPHWERNRPKSWEQPSRDRKCEGHFASPASLRLDNPQRNILLHQAASVRSVILTRLTFVAVTLLDAVKQAGGVVIGELSIDFQ